MDFSILIQFSTWPMKQQEFDFRKDNCLIRSCMQCTCTSMKGFWKIACGCLDILEGHSVILFSFFSVKVMASTKIAIFTFTTSSRSHGPQRPIFGRYRFRGRTPTRLGREGHPRWGRFLREVSFRRQLEPFACALLFSISRCTLVIISLLFSATPPRQRTGTTR